MLVRFDFPHSFNNFVDELLSTDITGRVADSLSPYPALEMAEYEHESVLVAELPGVKKEDIKIMVENGLLSLSGVRKPYEIPQDARILLNEVRVRNFNRTIELPHEVDESKISAAMENGVLRIQLPKSESARVRTIEVK